MIIKDTMIENAILCANGNKLRRKMKLEMKIKSNYLMIRENKENQALFAKQLKSIQKVITPQDVQGK